MRFDTRLVRLGQEPADGTGDVVPPIHVAATYERRAQDPPRYFYARGENPTREGLEECLAGLEDARHATAFSSGQAAGATALSLLDPGSRLIASDDLYGGTHALFSLLGRFGIAVDHVDLSDPDALDAAFGDDVAMVWAETPTNPLLKIADLAEVGRRARAHDALVLVDNTFAGPALQQPLRLGADITLYSTTKSIAGHSDVLGGALVYDDPDLHRAFRFHRTATGNVPGPFDCFLVHRGLKTLSLRTARQTANAAAIAAALCASPHVTAVHYPGLAGHPQHELAARQMSAPGSIVSFEYAGDPEKLMDRAGLFACAVSLGGVRSLIECPALMTHAPLPREDRLALGITDGLVRVSAGIEDPEDLVTDLVAALRPGEER
ncbi:MULTISPECIES: trans-sulfuration enzyme family protein [Thermomonosporaceae]|uniref:trans-sulfuration enzyme family protein n=1 Tax=Thermomonosporaceae TaxID=2012 RepID=UPI00255B04A9|nr:MULTISPECIES: aminotransferase class I/II-fold pyridoxal phosphate-dependent enzyme [Thermomonosporaceae]MDL4776690.1 PLP-dependent transferase [Actinomadura xylanilytica]